MTRKEPQGSSQAGSGVLLNSCVITAHLSLIFTFWYLHRASRYHDDPHDDPM